MWHTPKRPFSDGLGGNICFFWYTFLFSGVQLVGQLDTLLVFFNVFAANSTHIYCVPLLQNNLFVHSNANIIISGETAVSPFYFFALLIEFLKPQAKVQDSNNSFRSTREGWWFHAPSIISCSFRWISFKTAAKIQIIPQWGMNSIIFIPHWGILHIVINKWVHAKLRKKTQVWHELNL